MEDKLNLADFNEKLDEVYLRSDNDGECLSQSEKL